MHARSLIPVSLIAITIAAGSWGNLRASSGCPNVVFDGLGNVAVNSVDCATVSGGNNNTATGSYVTISGGKDNIAGGLYATIGGGFSHTVGGHTATIAGGYDNNAGGITATVGGGYQNSASAQNSIVGGGAANNATAVYGSILGGQSNTASGTHSTAVGGLWNTASGTYATVGGGVSNVAGADYATIAGGGRSEPGNVATGNRVTDSYGTVGGGGNNQAGDGDTTTAIGSFATVAGGLSNSAGNTFTTVAGGFQNSSNAFGAATGGGYQNVASGNYAAVPGGRSNAASGIYSLAAGYRAKATTRGSFVWADSTNANFGSTAANQFSVRATGGVRIVTNSAAEATGCSIPAGGASWQCTSDRNAKVNFAAVDSRSILKRVAALPIQSWNYKSQQATIKHIGPMAQDFAAAFGVGENDTTISTVDANGVALAAIQGLNQKLDQENQALKVRVEALEQRNVSSVPEPRTWIMLVGGLGLLNLLLLACVVMLVLHRRTTLV